MEGWKKEKEKEKEVKVPREGNPLLEAQNLEMDLQDLEEENRRKDLKRKEEGVQKGRRKKTKLPRLEGWGGKEEEEPPPNTPSTDPGVGIFNFQLGPELV